MHEIELIKKEPEGQKMKTHTQQYLALDVALLKILMEANDIIVFICDEDDSEGYFVTTPMAWYLTNNEIGSQSAFILME